MTLAFKYIFCDIDGTLSNCRHRQHLAHVDWDAFHIHLRSDTVIPPVLDFLRTYIAAGTKVVFITGRPERFRAQTMEWLAKECQLYLIDDYEAILMRPELEYRSDVKFKPELLQDWRTDNDVDLNPNEVLFLDDRDVVVAMWRDLGYYCWQPAQGAF